MRHPQRDEGWVGVWERFFKYGQICPISKHFYTRSWGTIFINLPIFQPKKQIYPQAYRCLCWETINNRDSIFFKATIHIIAYHYFCWTPSRRTPVHSPALINYMCESSYNFCNLKHNYLFKNGFIYIDKIGIYRYMYYNSKDWATRS